MRRMLVAVLAGAMTGNALPHVVKGIAGASYPTVFGDAARTNLVAGSAGLAVSGWLVRPAALGGGQAPVIAVGLLAAGV